MACSARKKQFIGEHIIFDISLITANVFAKIVFTCFSGYFVQVFSFYLLHFKRIQIAIICNEISQVLKQQNRFLFIFNITYFFRFADVEYDLTIII